MTFLALTVTPDHSRIVVSADMGLAPTKARDTLPTADAWVPAGMGAAPVMPAELRGKILRKGRDAGIHTAFAFLADECDYEFKAVAPQDELATLQREFIRAVNEQKALVERMQRVQVRAAS